MEPLSRELVFLILQFLEEENFKESLHNLERESRFFFNMKYFEQTVLSGELDEADKYLSGFTEIEENRFSMKIFFELRKQKYLEALDSNDKRKGVEILIRDLRIFSTMNEELFKEITHLLTLDNIRENPQLSKYVDSPTARKIVMKELKKLIEANPVFEEKLIYPTFKATRLRTLVNQSLNWQHQLCKNPKPNPDIKTLFTDHTCGPASGSRLAPAPLQLTTTPSPLVPAHGRFPPSQIAPNPHAMAAWMGSAIAASSVPPAGMPNTSMALIPPNQVSMSRNVRVARDYRTAEPEPLMKRLRPEVNTYPVQLLQKNSIEDLPILVTCTLPQGSVVTSMDFHPSRHTLLLVGMVNGDVSLWEISMRDRLTMRSFKIWTKTRSLQLQTVFAKEATVSVTRVVWSPDGNLIGVAFTKNLIHLYAFKAPNELHQALEVDAHFGQVNDVAFSYNSENQPCVVTCGEDKLIKVWSLDGQMMFIFEGHEAPVYSILPHHKENVQFIFSTARDGKIKAWLYDNTGPKVNYDAPGRWCTTMLYSADGSRLFSCGTSKDGDSYLVEWSESEGAIKKMYKGFRKKSAGVVQFDTAQNRFLAAGEDNQIKFWDFEHTNMLISTEADSSLPSLPRLRFNKLGNLLAVSTADDGVKILANANGLRCLRASGARALESLNGQQFESSHGRPARAGTPPVVTISSTSPVSKVEHSDRTSPARPSPILSVAEPSNKVSGLSAIDDGADKPEPLEVSDILAPQHCRVITIPETQGTGEKISRLLYTNSGVGIVALASNGLQRLWKWELNEQNPSGKASTNVVPQQWTPPSGAVMTNDSFGNTSAIACMALSKNGSYLMSACGGKATLFNMTTFKVLIAFMSPPPASTYLAFHPHDNNIVAVGMDDSTINIYNVRVDAIKNKLNGHSKWITGLAFSTSHNILVSSSADAQLCVWDTDSWEKKVVIKLPLPRGKLPLGDTVVQFNSDQSRLLVVHDTQLAIYDASKLVRVARWVPQDIVSAPISDATYSCNGQLVFAALVNGYMCVFDSENLRLKCRIAPTAYMPPDSNRRIYPCSVAAHPEEPDQFAIGFTDGAIKVMEPSESNKMWAPPVPAENEASISNGGKQTTSAVSSEPSDETEES